MTVFQRYLLIQIPGWILVAILLGGLYGWNVISLRVALILYAVYFLKDFVLYPFLRRAYETEEPSVMDRLIGARGVATENLGPAGYVRVGGELWQSRISEGCALIGEGSRIRVQSVDGMTLIVTADD